MRQPVLVVRQMKLAAQPVELKTSCVGLFEYEIRVDYGHDARPAAVKSAAQKSGDG